MKNIIIIIRQPLERRPPIINLLDVLIEIDDIKISLICERVSDHLRLKYQRKVEFITLHVKSQNNLFLKIYSWLIFRYKVFNHLKSISTLQIKNTLLWIGSADAALSLGKKLFQFKYIFQCHELYDVYPIYRKGLKKVMQKSLINVNPDDNRGAIFRSWYNLKETPITLPNKPYYHPRERNLKIEDENASSIIEKIKDKKIVLYQGGIVEGRDMSIVCEAIQSMGDEWICVLMGFTDGSSYLNKLIEKYSKTIYIPSIPVPQHLQVTSWARIGLLSYSFIDINHVFCAPNKTWEYTGFGIPMLGSNVPGIMNDINRYGSGKVTNFENNDVNSIIQLLNEIDVHYNKYVKGALDFYNSIEIVSIIKFIINKAEKYLL